MYGSVHFGRLDDSTPTPFDGPTIQLYGERPSFLPAPAGVKARRPPRPPRPRKAKLAKPETDSARSKPEK